MQTNKLLVSLSVAMLIGSGSLQGEEVSGSCREPKLRRSCANISFSIRKC